MLTQTDKKVLLFKFCKNQILPLFLDVRKAVATLKVNTLILTLQHAENTSHARKEAESNQDGQTDRNRYSGRSYFHENGLGGVFT